MTTNLVRLLECNIRNSKATVAQRTMRVFSSQQEQSSVEDDEGKLNKRESNI